MDFYVRHYWNDHRLQFKPRFNVTSITLEDDFSKQIWFPDTFFVDAKEMTIHQTMTASQSTLLRIASTGDVTHSTKVLLLASCSMNLKYFPIDQQRCTIEMASCKLKKKINKIFTKITFSRVQTEKPPRRCCTAG